MDSLHPLSRSYLALAVSFGVATALRNICFNPRFPIFGKDLQDNLAPIERDDVSWSWIAATRLWDLTLAIYIWSREAGGHRTKTDPPLLGVLLSTISRAPLYLILSHYFLLSNKTLFQVFLTDIFAASAALWAVSKIEPKHPAFFASSPDSPISLASLTSRNKLETIFYSVGLGTSLNALWSYIAERAFFHEWVRTNVLDLEVPAYLSALKPSLGHAMRHPAIAVPILRSAATPSTMPEHLAYNIPLPILTLILSLVYLPQKSPLYISILSFLIVTPSNILSSYNLLPLKLEAAAAIGLDNGLKAFLAAYIAAWITEDWRRPYRYQGSENALLKDVTAGGQNDIVIVDKNSITFVESVPIPEEAAAVTAE